MTFRVFYAGMRVGKKDKLRKTYRRQKTGTQAVFKASSLNAT